MTSGILDVARETVFCSGLFELVRFIGLFWMASGAVLCPSGPFLYTAGPFVSASGSGLCEPGSSVRGSGPFLHASDPALASRSGVICSTDMEW